MSRFNAERKRKGWSQVQPDLLLGEKTLPHKCPSLLLGSHGQNWVMKQRNWENGEQDALDWLKLDPFPGAGHTPKAF